MLREGKQALLDVRILDSGDPLEVLQEPAGEVVRLGVGLSSSECFTAALKLLSWGGEASSRACFTASLKLLLWGGGMVSKGCFTGSLSMVVQGVGPFGSACFTRSGSVGGGPWLLLSVRLVTLPGHCAGLCRTWTGLHSGCGAQTLVCGRYSSSSASMWMSSRQGGGLNDQHACVS